MSRSAIIPGHIASPDDEARRLHLATQTLFAASDDPARDRHCLLEPLRDAVIRHKTRRGQAICARLAKALVIGDNAGALAACSELIAFEAAKEPVA